jgi:flagellar basal body rod protein FlgF
MSEPTVELTKTSVTENDSGIYSLTFDVNIEDTNALKVDKCVLKY